MTAKEQLSELELDLRDKNKETLDLKQELDELKATNQEMTANMKELQNENGTLEEKACSLFDNVSSSYYFSNAFTAKDQLSDLELDLCDKYMDILSLNQELDELRAANQAVTADMEELQNENGNLEEEACGLFDKVNSNKLVNVRS